MLSILCSTLWGQAGGFSFGVFVGGLMVKGKHAYNREDVKEDELKKWYLNDLDENKYPKLDQVASKAAGAIAKAVKTINESTSLDDLSTKTDTLDGIVNEVINEDSLIYFKRYPNNFTPIKKTDSLPVAIQSVKAKYAVEIGSLNGDSANGYRGSTGLWRAQIDSVGQIRTRKKTELTTEINTAPPSIQGRLLMSKITDAGGLAANNLLVTTFDGAVTEYNAAKSADILNSNLATQGRLATATTNVTTAGNNLIDGWADAKVKTIVLERLEAALARGLLGLDDSIEAGQASKTADQKKSPPVDQYPFVSPVQEGTPPGEQGKWKTFKGETKSNRIGLTYGFSVGYEKEMNKNHAFVGGNAFAKKDDLTIKYDLQVDEGQHATFGELEAKPLYTFGVTVVAGKHLNPVFSVFGRGTFEFTKSSYTYNVTNDSPPITNEKFRTQEVGSWVKQAAVGVGARYNFAHLWSVEVCYDFVPATKTTVRDFNKLGDDNRRRGYIYTASQHRAFLKVVRFFNT